MDNRLLAVWGAGEMCRNYMKNGLKDVINLIIDNDKSKDQSTIEGIKIIHPDRIDNWRKYFIIIVSQYEKEISVQLEGVGLLKDIDFIPWYDYCRRDIPIEIVQEAMIDSLFSNDENAEIEEIVRTKAEYEKFKATHSNFLMLEKGLSQIYTKMPGRVGGYQGFCEACNDEVYFTVDYIWSTGAQPAWRETVTCPKCSCNSRMRYVIGRARRVPPNKDVYTYEQVTATYRELQKYFKDIIGSEYIDGHLKSGDVRDGIMHQDALNLSFDDMSFDLMISNDVFEHVADYEKALTEAYRCLRPGGKLILSIPIFKDRDYTTVCAGIDSQGQIEYYKEPVYHGNPLSSKGALVFYEFGWDFIDNIKKAGFSDAYAVVYSSAKKGHFGELPIIFEAVK